MTKTTTRLTAAVETYLADLQRIRASGGATGERLSYGPLANITLVSQYRSDWGMAFAGFADYGSDDAGVCVFAAISDEGDYCWGA